MKCPHCGEPIGETKCPACNRSLPEESLYCCWCGEAVVDTSKADKADEDEDEEEAIDFASRKLCSDGTCIGIIGPDGRCKECGKPYSGEPEVN